jgi:hypothetical protein
MSVNEVFDEFAVVRRSMKERIMPNQILQVQVRDEDSNVVRKHPTTWTSGGACFKAIDERAIKHVTTSLVLEGVANWLASWEKMEQKRRLG